MPSSLKILGQLELPTSWTDATIYTVPDVTDLGLGVANRFQTVVTSIVICNRNAGTNSYSIRVVPNGESPGVEHIVFNSVSITTNASDIISIGATIESGDKIEAFSASSDVSISIFGVETS